MGIVSGRLNKVEAKVCALLFIALFFLISFYPATVYGAVLTEESKVSIQKIEGGSGSVSVGWEAVEGATRYILSRSTDGQTWTEVYSGALLEFTDTGLENYRNYYYQLKATDEVLTVQTPVSSAFPPNTSPHGHYGLNTGLCALCHVTHASKGAKLLAQPSSSSLCTICHDGTQSKYNVLEGEVLLPGGIFAESNAGPFGSLLTGISPINTAAPHNYVGTSEVNLLPSSIHNLGARHDLAPGASLTNTFMEESPLACLSCHNPHNESNYRMLKIDPGTNEGTQLIPFQAVAITNTGTNKEEVTYTSGSVYFCGNCHSDFNQIKGSSQRLVKFTEQTGFDLSLESIDYVMHAVEVNKSYQGLTSATGVPYENDKIVCLTCHRAHGTVVSGGSAMRTGKQSTALKRKPENKICEECHQKSHNP